MDVDGHRSSETIDRSIDGIASSRVESIDRSIDRVGRRDATDAIDDDARARHRSSSTTRALAIDDIARELSKASHSSRTECDDDENDDEGENQEG